ncbi:MAG TPA: DUF58 domain-containing protein [Streptosporangiaceae bacterium]|nr:DUF58 domain-containing protein [Streptosporangiaceae bacterium]
MTPLLTPGQRRELPVTWQLSAHARRLVTVAVTGLLIAVITRRPEFAGLAAPALLLLLPGRGQPPASLGVQVATTSGPVTEGEPTAILVRVSGYGDGQVRLALHAATWITPGEITAAGDGWWQITFVPERWGARPVGTLEVVVYDRWRLADCRVLTSVPPLTCYPRAARLDSLIVLSKLPPRLGEHTSRLPGEGIEFAGVREFVPGDRQRRINWPATTRRGTLQLNTFTAERAQTIVILMDVSIDVGEAGRSSSDLAVRAAAGTAARYLAARDRVGLISYGRQLTWISPAGGRRQADRIMQLITAARGPAYPPEMLASLSRDTLPPGGLIIVFSPLLSVRLIEGLRALRERGFATIVVDVLTAEPGAGLGRHRAMADLARRIWRMEQDAIRFSLREIGIPVVYWDGRSPLDEPLARFLRRPVVNR